MLAAWTRRVGEGDTYDLAEFAAFRDEVEGAIGEAIDAARASGSEAWSWQDVGDALGVTRQAAQKRHGTSASDATAAFNRHAA